MAGFCVKQISRTIKNIKANFDFCFRLIKIPGVYLMALS